MGGPYTDALRISPNFTTDHWRALKRDSKPDWGRAAAMVKDRLDGRFLRYAGNCLRSPYSGFVVLAIDSLLLETLQQFREGVTDGKNMSAKLIKRFLEGPRFQPEFDSKARQSYYEDIRCGLLHQAEARKMWLIRRGQSHMLRPAPSGDGYVIDVELFHRAVRASMNDYLRALRHPASDELRAHLWVKMDQICNVRRQRGAVYAIENGPADRSTP